MLVIRAKGGALRDGAPGTTVLCRGVVAETGAPAADLTHRLRSGVGLERLGAPFAAMHSDAEEVVVAADHIGLHHVYGAQQDDWAAVGTSARALAQRCGRGLDLEALSVFRLAGHYLDRDTAYAGVRKLAPAHLWRLRDGELKEIAYPGSIEPVNPDARAHAARLRELVDGFLDHHDDVRLELSGGLDSRLVLAAVSRHRRPKVTAFTLVNGQGTDAKVAARLAQRYGMRFECVDVGELSGLTEAQAYEMAVAAAIRQDGLGRPLSAAVFHWAESRVPQAPRLSGHGGEMARGLFGPGVEFERPHATVRDDVVRAYIRRWMISNDAAADAALDPEFAAASRQMAMARLVRTFQQEGSDWFGALAGFYLRQRMHRFGGITITDGCRSRVSLNPLADFEVLRLTGAVPMRDRFGSRYAVRVLDQLDPDLARVPLGSGVRPIALNRTLTMTRVLGENTWRGFAAKAGGKVVRALSSQRRSAVGAALLAQMVVRHWQTEPSLVEPVRKTGLISHDWLSRMIDGRAPVDANTVDFLLNLAVITQTQRF